MVASLNRNSLLWAIGVMQPVSMNELYRYLRSILPEAGEIPEPQLLHGLAMEETKSGSLIRIARGPDLFSLTLYGNHILTKAQRQSRDRERIFLLHEASRSKRAVSREVSALSLDGDSPSQSLRIVTEGSEAKAPGPSIPQARALWPRHSKQLFGETGFSSNSRDTFIPLLSFVDFSQLAVARGEKGLPSADCTALGLMIGISPKLILQIYARPFRHYRSYTIPKKNGSPRLIESPRVFLKVVQKFIADYLLADVKIHENVHSFRRCRSIITNAGPHVGKRWVANLDIVDFFNSITSNSVASIFTRNGFDPTSGKILAELTTYFGRLPQGAPSSPKISNAFLYEFDEYAANNCLSFGLNYTRYADDISISGESRHGIDLIIDIIAKNLSSKFGLKLNAEKQRVLSRRSQQRVTGVVVNEKIMPPRKLRREVRSAIHNASKSINLKNSEAQKIKGYLSHFSSFNDFRDTAEFRSLVGEFGKIKT